MMRSGWMVGMACLVAGCGSIPGTNAYKMKHAQATAAESLIDPSSVQFRSVRVGKEGGVCGELNGKNRMGAYVGFTRWVAMPTSTQPSGWLAQLDPQFDAGDKASADDFCASVRSNSYSSSSTVTSACERADEESAKQLMQQMFDRSWNRLCQ